LSSPLAIHAMQSWATLLSWKTVCWRCRMLCRKGSLIGLRQSYHFATDFEFDHVFLHLVDWTFWNTVFQYWIGRWQSLLKCLNCWWKPLQNVICYLQIFINSWPTFPLSLQLSLEWVYESHLTLPFSTRLFTLEGTHPAKREQPRYRWRCKPVKHNHYHTQHHRLDRRENSTSLILMPEISQILSTICSTITYTSHIKIT